jgi:hypothetical protein
MCKSNIFSIGSSEILLNLDSSKMDNQFQLPHLTTPIHDPCGWTRSVGLYMQVNRHFFFMLPMKTSKIQISFLLTIELLK